MYMNRIQKRSDPASVKRRNLRAASITILSFLNVSIGYLRKKITRKSYRFSEKSLCF